MGTPPKNKKKKVLLSDSFRSESSSPGRAISYSWRATFRGCIMQGRKSAKGSNNSIEHRSHHHHPWTSAEEQIGRSTASTTARKAKRSAALRANLRAKRRLKGAAA
jgi:hypothetical protein